MTAGVWVVVPTYDEAGTIAELIRRVHDAVPDAHVLVVDDGSPDGTAGIAQRAGAEVLRRTAKEGLAAAYRAGFARALDDGARFVCQMDADLSHDPAVLPRMLAAMAHADVVLGSRYVPGGGVEDWSRGRRALSRGGSAYARRVLGIGVRDLTGGFKCFRREALEAVDMDTVRSRGYAFQIETTYRAIQAGFRVAEIPITFRERAAGASKMTPAIALEAAWRVPLLRRQAPRPGPRPVRPLAAMSRKVLSTLVALVLLGTAVVFAAASGSNKPAPPHPVPPVQPTASPVKRTAPQPPAGAMAPAQRARDATRAAVLYQALQRQFYSPAEHLFLERTLSEVRAGKPAHHSFLWPYSQAASAILAANGIPGAGGNLQDLIAGFERYWDTAGIPAYAFRVQLASADPNEHKYYDDEGWVALDLLRLYDATGSTIAFQRAQQEFDFLVSGWDASRAHAGPGGVLWKQPPHNTTRTTVSTATAGEVAVRLYLLTGKASYLAWARTMQGWLQRCLAEPNGLLRDHIDRAGHVDPSTYSYNQGSGMALDALLAQATGNQGYLRQGLKLARSAVRTLTTSRLAGETAIFPSIFFDDLLRFPAPTAAEHDAWRARAQAWADHEWNVARDPSTNLVRRPGGTPPQLIDQASLLQLYADLAHDGAARPAGA